MEKLTTESASPASLQASPRARLMRDRHDRMLAGVCAGLGAYLDIDIALVRVFFALLLFGGIGFPLYVVLWIAMPEAPIDAAVMSAQVDGAGRRRFAQYAGVALIGWGALVLMRELGLPGMRWITGDLLLPLALVVVGLVLLLRAGKVGVE
jgi:phage shock protein C